ncbi:hypothetical protein V2A60_006702 [Cordyceps javanica]|uniref:Short-chain dehydrogenase reductase family n=1 Tax=Cordyceps javanica TaxID=43265 RepID=A0A545V757_9HYPO|nr:short-chain dehydrogenase reductase family [Cordyceps javanica]TQW09267.1 short-chain dehydrogenase reductase family [Cordyceps javanica]
MASSERGLASPARFPGVALITGAGGTGIGSAVARAFARSGCPKIAITDIDRASLVETESSLLSLNPRIAVLALCGDISDDSFVQLLIDDTIQKFQRVDYLVQCAGVLGKPQRSHETSVHDFDRINNVNYRGAWLVSRQALAHMVKQEPLPEHPKQRAAIVHIASQLGIVAKPGAAPYCASKAAVINMTRSDAIDYSADGIRINCVCPGIIATQMTTGTKEIEDSVRPAIPIAPMNRMGTTDEIAEPVLFLCSAQASFIQGHAMVVDGGYTIN